MTRSRLPRLWRLVAAWLLAWSCAGAIAAPLVAAGCCEGDEPCCLAPAGARGCAVCPTPPCCASDAVADAAGPADLGAARPLGPADAGRSLSDRRPWKPPD